MARQIDWDRQLSRRLKLRELDVFIAVAKHGSMARAAIELGLTQPSVSEMMANLERALGLRLLDRSTKGVVPTIYGQTLLRGSVAAIDDLQQMIKALEALADPTAGEVKVGCPETVAVLLPPIVERLSRTHPRVLVHMSDIVAPTLDIPQLRDRTLDVAIVRFAGPAEQHAFVEDFDVDVVFNDELVVVAGKNSRWARDRHVDIERLADAPWVLPPLTTSNSRTVFEAFRERGLGPPRIAMATFSVHLRTIMAAKGSHVSVLPQSIVPFTAERSGIMALPIKLPKHDFPLAIVTLRRRMPNPVVQLFIKHAHSSLRANAMLRRTRSRA
ncbi:MAG: LysR family transcriptional regulator [Hyphomicrobiaceae bacterium]|nr:LysR family transcriptional regulator [Hyphomicrobiaceae bacterium]